MVFHIERTIVRMVFRLRAFLLESAPKILRSAFTRLEERNLRGALCERNDKYLCLLGTVPVGDLRESVVDYPTASLHSAPLPYVMDARSILTSRHLHIPLL
jgi:hypothetical protein